MGATLLIVAWAPTLPYLESTRAMPKLMSGYLPPLACNTVFLSSV